MVITNEELDEAWFAANEDIESKQAAVRYAYELAAQIAGRHRAQASSAAEAAVARSIEKEIRWLQGSRCPRKKDT